MCFMGKYDQQIEKNGKLERMNCLAQNERQQINMKMNDEQGPT